MRISTCNVHLPSYVKLAMLAPVGERSRPLVRDRRFRQNGSSTSSMTASPCYAMRGRAPQAS